MSNKIKSVIPKPCQENWLELNAEEKVRFCTLCQKNVFDFANDGSEKYNDECLKYSSTTNNSKSKPRLIDKISDFLIHRK
ncbi:MAG: hypothetical protein K2P85_12450 [Flavobacteriaceae bacterium]|nr:hypothetical protein [Flavobacteriaceae bacterium]